MSTIRWTAACASLLLLVCAADAQDAPKPSGVAKVEVPSGPLPVLDGKIGDKEWQPAAVFTVGRREETFGQGWMRRAGRELVLAYKSEFAAYALGVRITFSDPTSRRLTHALITPIHPPGPPLSVFREMPGRKAERLEGAACGARFDFSPKEGFTLELRIPLDLLEVARSDKAYGFSVEVWDLEQRQILAAYPLAVEGVMGGKSEARMAPVGDWGADEPLDAKPMPPNEAIRLLDRIDAELSWYMGSREGKPPPAVLQGFIGDRDGQRKDAPLEAMEKRLRTLMERYPDYLSLRANLVRTLRGRNRFEPALEVLDSIERDFPLMDRNIRHVFIKSELLFSMGRYADAVAYVEARRERLGAAATDRTTRLFGAMTDAWKAELAIREEEAKRDDLPRVRLKTSKGDILLELFEDDAPNGVANFITLVEDGFYDGTKFHWVAGGGRVFGGDPNSRDANPHNDGFGDPGYLIESQPSRRLMFRGTIVFADKRYQRRTEGCTFTINITPLPDLDGLNTVFGRVIEGFEVLCNLEQYDTLEEAKIIRKRNHPYKVVKR